MKKMILIALMIAIPNHFVFGDTEKKATKTKGKAVAKAASKSQTSKSSASKAKVNAKSAPKKTIGQILQSIDQKSQTLGVQKTATSLPTFQPIFQSSNPVHSGPQNLNNIKPPSSKEIFKPTGSDEDKLERATDQSIAELYKLTIKFKNSPNRGELWLRLGEQYVEKAFLVNLRIQKEYESKEKDFEEKRAKVKPVLNLNIAREYNKKAIQLYAWFLRDYPKDPKVDQALFFLGYNFFEMGETKKGSVYYDRLTKEHRSSPFIHEAQFSLGEFNFENLKYKQALDYYKEVAKYKNHRLFTLSLYKWAWCEYRLGNTLQALNLMEKVIFSSKATQTEGEGRKVNKIRLVAEAINDMIIFYAQVSEPEKAREYFGRFAKDETLKKTLEKLAYYYRDFGRKEAAKYVFNLLIQQDPLSPKAFEYQYQIVQTFATADMKSYRAELFTWIQNYNDESEWYRANKNDTKLVADAREQRERALREHVLILHREGQKSHAEQTMKLADGAYKMFITTFASSAKIPEMRFFYAELLYDMERFSDAGAQYLWVADNAPRSEYAEKSVLNTLLALEKSLPSDQDIKKRIGNNLNPVEFGTVEKNFEQGSLRYLKSYPKTEKSIDVKFRLARLYYSFNQFDSALKLFREVIKDKPNSPNAEFSANLILDIYNLRKDYEGMVAAGNELMNTSGLDKTKIDTDVKGVVERASLKKALDLEKANDFIGSAKKYEEFSQAHPNSELKISALFNAAVNYEKAGQGAQATQMYASIAKSTDDKNKDLRTRSVKNLVGIYEKTGQYSKAIGLYEQLLTQEKNPTEVANLHYNLAVIYAAQGNHAKAVQNYEKYFTTSKKVERLDSLFLIGQIYYKQKKFSTANKYYEQYINSGTPNANYLMMAYYRNAKCYEQAGNATKAHLWFAKVVATQKSLSSKKPKLGAKYAAEAKYYLSQDTVNQYLSLKLPKNPNQQGRVIKEKLALLDKYNRELVDVIKYDDGEQVVNSLTSLGAAYEHMYRTFVDSPRPAGLNDEEMKAYNDQIFKVADPMLAKAKENYQSAVDRSFELQVYGPHTLNAQKSLHRLDSTKFADQNTKTLPVSAIDTMGM